MIRTPEPARRDGTEWSCCKSVFHPVGYLLRC
jgi:hypothetical protein